MGTTLILPASSLRHSKFSSLLSCAAPFFFFFFFFFVSFFFSFFFPCLRACPRRWRRSRLLSSLSCVLKLSALARPRRFSPDPGAGDNRRNPRGAAWDRRSVCKRGQKGKGHGIVSLTRLEWQAKRVGSNHVL